MGFEKPFRLVALSIALFHILILLSACEGHKVLCKAHEREALLHFRDGLSVDSQEKVLSSWVEEEDCCKWKGIGCNNLTGHVVEVNLERVRGNIGPSLVDLIHLQYLNLSYNDFGGCSIPEYFGSFKELLCLKLLRSNISGIIPPQLGNISTLEALLLSDVDGRLESDCTWISQLSSLREIVMVGVSLSKATHLFRELNKLPFISVIALIDCELEPLFFGLSLDYVNFTHLSVLDVSTNYMDFRIPQWLFNVTTVEYLDLSENNIIRVDEIVQNLCNPLQLYLFRTNLTIDLGYFFKGCNRRLYLEELDLSYNQITGQLPSWLGDYKNLTYLILENNLISGPIPESIGGMTSLEYLDLSYNKLIGNIPMSIGGLTSCWIFDLSNNNLNGSIPSLGRLKSSMEFVDLSSNMLEGPFPSISNGINYLFLSDNKLSGPLILRNVSSLIVLSLSNNNLSGKIPSTLCNTTMLSIPDLSDNHFSGRLQTCMANSNQLIYQGCSIESLHLNNNNLQGTLPAWLKFCSNMRVIDIGENRFQGNIPSWIAENMTMLQVLRLRSNSFYGVIPFQLSNLKGLQVIDLAENNLSGSIPSTFGDFFSMKTRHLDNETIGVSTYYMESIMVTFKNQYMHFDRNLKFLSSMDLSGNRLSGEIPRVLGDLYGLVNLNLSQNNLIGNIPASFSQLKQLESLDLSSNNISGCIPQSLSLLTYLSTFIVSFNNLSGRIPTGYQFDDFPNSSYVGNAMLCGRPLDVCKDDHEPTTPLTKTTNTENANDYEYLWLYIGFVIGFVMGFWTFYASLIIKMNWRCIYFQFIDNGCKKYISLFRRH